MMGVPLGMPLSSGKDRSPHFRPSISLGLSPHVDCSMHPVARCGHPPADMWHAKSAQGPRPMGTVCLVTWLMPQPFSTAWDSANLPFILGKKNSTAATSCVNFASPSGFSSSAR